MTNFRALCAELHAAVQLYTGQNPAAADTPPNELVSRLMDAMAATAAALAQPEPQGPTDEDVVAACPFDSFHEPAEYHGWWSAIEWMEQRYGRPAIEPVPVNERPWEREGWCNAHQRCWAWNEGNCRWWEFIDSRMISFSHDDYTHCLPHWALPVPKSNSITQGDQ